MYYILTCTCTLFNLEFRVAKDKLQCSIFKLQDKNSIVINTTKIVKLVTTF